MIWAQQISGWKAQNMWPKSTEYVAERFVAEFRAAQISGQWLFRKSLIDFPSGYCIVDMQPSISFCGNKPEDLALVAQVPRRLDVQLRVNRYPVPQERMPRVDEADSESGHDDYREHDCQNLRDCPRVRIF